MGPGQESVVIIYCGDSDTGYVPTPEEMEAVRVTVEEAYRKANRAEPIVAVPYWAMVETLLPT